MLARQGQERAGARPLLSAPFPACASDLSWAPREGWDFRSGGRHRGTEGCPACSRNEKVSRHLEKTALVVGQWERRLQGIERALNTWTSPPWARSC